MLITTVYNQANAVLTGFYHTAKGEKINVECMGSALECMGHVNSIRSFDDGSNEVQSVVLNVAEKVYTNVSTGFALHNAWSSVVGA